ncbi:hypothetical protein LJC20_00345 [Eubacteriales bacterium OttesenSCG-928-M02]|nr:hypothetical protein [Eubacteriales bacterium OttesenSCG-928-M02]
MMSRGRICKESRQKRGISQVELSQKTYRSERSYIRYETAPDYVNIPEEVIKGYADVCKDYGLIYRAIRNSQLFEESIMDDYNSDNLAAIGHRLRNQVEGLAERMPQLSRLLENGSMNKAQFEEYERDIDEYVDSVIAAAMVLKSSIYSEHDRRDRNACRKAAV